MPIKPGPVLITVGGHSLLADAISTSYDVEFFDRVEFDHEKLKSVPLSTGVTPQLVSLLGGVPAEVTISCALGALAGSYVPRPLTPNAYPADYNNIKQRFDIVRIGIQGGQTPESAIDGSIVDAILPLRESSRNMLAQFQTRIAAFGGTIAYETLLAAQSDNIFALYFTTGIGLVLPDLTASNVLITDFQETHEFVIPSRYGGYDILKGYNMTLEVRTIVSALS